MYALFVQFTEPYFLLMASLGIALGVLRRGENRLTGRRWWSLAGPYVVLYLLSTVPISGALLAILEWRHPYPTEWPADRQAIVVVSAAFAPPSERLPHAVPSGHSLIRTEHAAHLQRTLKLPVLCSGGLTTPTARESDARLMGKILENLQVPPDQILLEEESRTTYENAVRSAELLSSRGITRVILVTDAIHMRRAVLCFEKQGIDVVPAPCVFHFPEWPPLSVYWFLPTFSSLARSHGAAHEGLGLIWYWLQGRI